MVEDQSLKIVSTWFDRKCTHDGRQKFLRFNCVFGIGLHTSKRGNSVVLCIERGFPKNEYKGIVAILSCGGGGWFQKWTKLLAIPVNWCCRIYWLYPYRRLISASSNKQVSWLWHLIIWWFLSWSFEEYRVPLHCHTLRSTLTWSRRTSKGHINGSNRTV